MQHNAPPSPPKRLAEALLGRDTQFRAWMRRRNSSINNPHYSFDGTEGEKDGLGMDELTENQLAYLAQEILKRRHREEPDLLDLVHDEMVATTPKLGQPEFTDLGEDLSLIWGQPEMLELWAKWSTPRPAGTRGEYPNDAPAKATLALMAMGGLTHAERATEVLYRDPSVRQVFADIDKAAYDLAAQKGIVRPPVLKPFTPSLYEGITARFPFLCGEVVHNAKKVQRPTCNARNQMLRINGLMFKALRDLYPDEGLGRTLLIDGTLFPAWCEQRGVGETPAVETQRRRTCPKAGARAISYGRGKVNLRAGDSVSASQLGSAKFVRGYYYIVLLDQASGWPLVSTVQDASDDEADALIPLLRDLYEYHPGIEVERVVGDGAWDEVWAHRLCELEYGIAPVFRHSGRSEPRADISMPAGASHSKSITGITHSGQVRHPNGKLMRFDGFQRPDRDGLRPGQPCQGKRETDEWERNLEQRARQFKSAS